MSLLARTKTRYLMPRHHNLFGWDADLSSGFYHVGSAARLWGGVLFRPAGGSLPWVGKFVFSPGIWRCWMLGDTYNYYGIASLWLGGVDTGVRLDCYTPGVVHNSVRYADFTVDAKRTVDEVRLSWVTFNPASSGQAASVAQLYLEKISPGQDLGNSWDDCPWQYPINLWDSDSILNFDIASTLPQGGQYYPFPSANGSYLDYQISLTPGTWQLEGWTYKANNRGVARFLLDGHSIGVVDMYSAVNALRKFSVGPFSISASAPQQLRILADGTSGSGYGIPLSSLLARRLS